MNFDIEIHQGPGAHWGEVRELLARVSMGGALPVTIQRAAQQAHAYLTLGGVTIDVLARHQGQLVGFAHTRLERRMLWNGSALSPGLISLGGDLRVATAHRGQGLIRTMSDRVRAYAMAQGWLVAWGLVNEGNTRTYEWLMSERHGQRARLARTFTTASRLLWRAPGRPRVPVLEPFSPTDAELEALPAQWAHRLLGPAPDSGVMTRVVRALDSITFFRRVRDGAYVTALWNPRRARQIRLSQLTAPLWLARGLWNGAQVVTGAARFPGVGEAVETVELAFTVRERLDAAALAQLTAEAHGLGGHVLNVVVDGLHDGEVLPVKGAQTRLRTRLITLSEQGTEPPQAPPHLPVYLDLSVL